MTRLKIILAASLLSASAIAFTAHAKPDADTNQDGEISRAEFDAMSQRKFDTSDINGDGYVSQDERTQSRENRKAEKRAEHFASMDRNGDGSISQSEFESGSEDRREAKDAKRAQHKEKMRAYMDANNDGEITQEDKDLMREKYRAKREARKAMRGSDEGESQRSWRGDRSGSDGHRSKKDHWAKIDINGDGLISAQEHMAGATKMFDHMDANGDNVLSQGEGMRRHKKRRRMFGR